MEAVLLVDLPLSEPSQQLLDGLLYSFVHSQFPEGEASSLL